jgi:hypothetical protein
VRILITNRLDLRDVVFCEGTIHTEHAAPGSCHQGERRSIAEELLSAPLLMMKTADDEYRRYERFEGETKG